MPLFTYKARDDDGRLITGKMEASSKKKLEARLEDCGFFLVDCTTPSKSIFEGDIFKNFIPVTDKNLYVLTVQLGNTVSTGVPLLTSLESIIESTKNQKLASVLNTLKLDLSEGSTLAQSMLKHPKIFSQFYVSMIELGESSGALSKILSALADYIKKEMEIKRKIQSALAYPTIVFFLGTGVIIFLLTFVLPQFIQIFKEQNVALPLPTQILLMASTIMTHYWYLLLGFVIAAFISFKLFVRSDYGKLVFDQFLLKIPVLGQVTKKICVQSFVDGLYLLYANGLPIVSALNLVRPLLRNRHLGNIVHTLAMHISSGESLTTYLSLTDFFPSDILAMIKSGEESGTLEKTLAKISEIYDDEVNTSIAILIQAFEMGIILAMGLGVAFVAMSVLLPIFQMGQVVSK